MMMLWQMSVAKDERCWLLDNSHKLMWRVRSAAGQEGMVPAVCFHLPPPDRDARRTVARLQAELAAFRARWSERQRTLRYNMIFATISVVRSWDLQQVLTHLMVDLLKRAKHYLTVFMQLNYEHIHTCMEKYNSCAINETSYV